MFCSSYIHFLLEIGSFNYNILAKDECLFGRSQLTYFNLLGFDALQIKSGVHLHALLLTQIKGKNIL